MFLTDIIVSHLVSEVGIIGVFMLWVMYQVYSPGWMPKTKLQKIAGDIESEVRETKHMLVSTITVLRAVVRTNEEVDTERVDDYLVENGVEPDDFIREKDLPSSANKTDNPGDD